MNRYIQKALLGTSAAALAFATSCGGDDASPDLLVGEWDLENQGGPGRLFGGVYSSANTFNFGSDGYFGYCQENFIDGVSQDKYCYKNGEWEWIEKNKSVKLIGSSRARLDGISGDLIFTFAELDGDSFLAVVGIDEDGDDEMDYVYAALKATRVGDAEEWTEFN